MALRDRQLCAISGHLYIKFKHCKLTQKVLLNFKRLVSCCRCKDYIRRDKNNNVRLSIIRLNWCVQS